MEKRGEGLAGRKEKGEKGGGSGSRSVKDQRKEEEGVTRAAPLLMTFE